MRKQFAKNILIINGILIIIGYFSNVFAANPSFDIYPGSGSNLKLHCRYLFNAKLNAGGQSYNGFDYMINFNSGETNIIHSAVDPFFSSSPAGFIKSGYLYRSYGAATTGSAIDRNLTTFIFYTISNIGSSILNFTNCDGGTIAFGSDTTADCAVVNGYSVGGLDILTGINDATYNFSTLPCVPDIDNPTISNVSISNGSTQIPSNQNIFMLINDRQGNPTSNVSGPAPLENNKRSHYRYSGLNTTLGNYVAAPSSVDNQEGINSGSIKITVTAPSYPSYGTYILSGSSLTISDFTGNGSINKFTWDSEIRGYNISFSPPSPYPVEKQISITITAKDKANELGQTHTGTYSFSFNSPIAPVISMLSPSTTTFISPTLSQIKFYITDDRAGINTGSIKFTIPAIYSGAILLMSGYTYSGDDLTFVLSGGSAGLGSGGDYIVSFVPKRNFPSNTGISITGLFLDLAGTTGSANFSFSTRPECSYFGCSTFLGIDIDGITSNFDGKFLIITGTNPDGPYPYFTGINNDILMCGPNFTGTSITGNIPLNNTNSQSILGIHYTGTQLYITGLDIILSGNIVFIQ
ncbi:MAG: hypothetical protein WAZ12_03340 [Candidatus Absconditicoccaceae bacterium]